MEKEKCKAKVFTNWHHYPCSRNAWKDGYCKQHHPAEIKKKNEARDRKWREENDARIANSPYTKIKKLEAMLQYLWLNVSVLPDNPQTIEVEDYIKSIQS